MSIYKKCPHCDKKVSIFRFISFRKNWDIKNCPHCSNTIQLNRSKKNHFVRGIFYGVVPVGIHFFFQKWFKFEIFGSDFSIPVMIGLSFFVIELISLTFSKLEKAPE